jgi:peptidoglycan/xylan/chitin deacetylase (PgdA/CDA1 family)
VSPLQAACAGLSLVACLAPPAATPSRAATPSAKSPSVAAPSETRRCVWPNGAKAAASLTYDDGLASQLRSALPVLDHHGIKATFFLSGSNMADFAVAAKSGHELGAHTVKHPCNADLLALSVAGMAKELDDSRARVTALGQAGQLSFAYPCGQVHVAKGESYVPLVQERFIAARGVAGVVAQPESLDLYNVPALFPPSSSDGGDVIAFIERAKASRGWAVIGVHGVSEAGEYLQWSQAAHDKVVAYLAEHRAELWTAPFGTVADFVKACPLSSP